MKRIECPFCGKLGLFSEGDFDIDEGDGLICRKCDKWFLFDWDEFKDDEPEDLQNEKD